MKPNNVMSYVSTSSNHPPMIFKNVPKGVNDRLCLLSSSEEVFKATIPPYEAALDSAGYKHTLKYYRVNLNDETRRRKCRKKNVLWYNPPRS